MDRMEGWIDRGLKQIQNTDKHFTVAEGLCRTKVDQPLSILLDTHNGVDLGIFVFPVMTVDHSKV